MKDETEFKKFCEICVQKDTDPLGRKIFKNATTLEDAIEIYMSMEKPETTTVYKNKRHKTANKEMLSAECDEVRSPQPQKIEKIIDTIDTQEDMLYTANKNKKYGVKNNIVNSQGINTVVSPPKNLLQEGDMGIGREVAISKCKWQVLNIQNHNNFSSYLQDRDIWTNNTIKSLLQSLCVFQQHDITTNDGKYFIDMYSILKTPCPVIAFLDPITLCCKKLQEPITFSEAGSKGKQIYELENFLTYNPLPPSFSKVNSSDAFNLSAMEWGELDDGNSLLDSIVTNIHASDTNVSTENTIEKDNKITEKDRNTTIDKESNSTSVKESSHTSMIQKLLKEVIVKHTQDNTTIQILLPFDGKKFIVTISQNDTIYTQYVHCAHRLKEFGEIYIKDFELFVRVPIMSQNLLAWGNKKINEAKLERSTLLLKYMSTTITTNNNINNNL